MFGIPSIEIYEIRASLVVSLKSYLNWLPVIKHVKTDSEIKSGNRN
jgi:hypothetical protein